MENCGKDWDISSPSKLVTVEKTRVNMIIQVVKRNGIRNVLVDGTSRPRYRLV